MLTSGLLLPLQIDPVILAELLLPTGQPICASQVMTLQKMQQKKVTLVAKEKKTIVERDDILKCLEYSTERLKGPTGLSIVLTNKFNGQQAESQSNDELRQWLSPNKSFTVPFIFETVMLLRGSVDGCHLSRQMNSFTGRGEAEIERLKFLLYGLKL